MNRLIVGIVQGLTEFLPVSSSGHLVVAQNLLGVNRPGIGFEVLLHVATLTAIFVYFWRDILKLFRRERIIKHPFFYLFIASIPAGVVGVLFNEKIEGLFETVQYVKYFFLVNSLILFTLFITKRKKEKTINLKIAFLIGIAQALAIIPGISRSGSTITMALLLGVNEREAFSFSFLLSIPAILGAAFLKAGEVEALNISGYILPFFAALLSGLFALFVLKRITINNKIQYFGFYTLCLALFLIIFV